MDQKISLLKQELDKYQQKLQQLTVEYSQTKEGSRYGVEYYDIQIRVYQSMIESIKKEISQIQKKK